VAEPDGHKYASELLNQVVKMNNGFYLDEELESAAPTNFCIGVAGYPEKHFNAPNLKSDLKYLKLKVDMGAEYIVTQMFFDNKKYFDFVDTCREVGIHVPIIPGLKPLTGKSQLTVLPKTFHIDIPEELSEEAEKCKDNTSLKEVGIRWAIHQSKELIKRGVPTLHFYSMGKSDPIYRIAKELF
jgi:methylenetetrahydrofolate reductase (NADPH)